MLSTTKETLRTPRKRNICTDGVRPLLSTLRDHKEAIVVSYILTKKGKVRASADVGFMPIAYNLRRIGNILTLKVLKEYLGILVSVFWPFSTSQELF
jgi:hypothetical protein